MALAIYSKQTHTHKLVNSNSSSDCSNKDNTSNNMFYIKMVRVERIQLTAFLNYLKKQSAYMPTYTAQCTSKEK